MTKRAAQKRNTISAIWSGHERVRRHFHGAARTDPGPDFPDWLIIPQKPYTKTQATAAKKSSTFPGLEADRYPEDSQGNNEDGIAVGETEAEVEGPVVVDPVVDPIAPELNVRPDERPYQFWPELPWEDGPDPHVPVDDRSPRQLKFWLDSGAPDAVLYGRRWRGVRRLGKGGFGIAGLWVQVDMADRIIDVGHKVAKNEISRDLLTMTEYGH